MKEALLRMIRAADKALEMDKALSNHGYKENPYADIFGDIADAIYYLVGEKKNCFEDSVTYWVLHGDLLTEEDKLEILLEVYRKNRPARN